MKSFNNTFLKMAKKMLWERMLKLTLDYKVVEEATFF